MSPARAKLLIPATVHASVVKASVLARGDRRLEAETYLSGGYELRQRIESIDAAPLETLAKVWQPGRLKGIQVGPERGTPFLAATQVFDIRPAPRKWLSLPHTPDVDGRFLERGWILVTCSGSVGDTIMAYRPLDGIIVSHDLLRVVPLNDDDRGYLYSYLRTSYARDMMRGTKYGNVIKHLEPEHLRAVPVPNAGDRIKATLNSAIERCFVLRDESYDLRLAAEKLFSDEIGEIDVKAAEVGFAVKVRDLLHKSRRLDAYSYNPRAAAILKAIRRANRIVEPLSEVTERVFLPNRFIRTTSRDGVPLLGSEDLFTVNPELNKFVLPSTATPDLLVKRGWLLVARSGQIYGINGQVALADRWHEKKVISEDAIRVVPKNIRPGYLLVALGHPTLGRPLVLREVFGTSIPHIDPTALQDVPVVRLGELETSIADKAERSSALHDLADAMENAAVAVVESVIAHSLGDAPDEKIDAALANLRLMEIESDPSRLLKGAALGKKIEQWQS